MEGLSTEGEREEEMKGFPLSSSELELSEYGTR
jgi:hypothetical protein